MIKLTTPRNRRNQETSSPLRMPPDPSKRQRENSSEAARLKHEDHDEKRDTRIALRVHSGDREDRAHTQVRSQHEARPEERDGHETCGDEAVCGVETLGDGEEVGWAVLVGFGYMG